MVSCILFYPYQRRCPLGVWLWEGEQFWAHLQGRTGKGWFPLYNHRVICISSATSVSTVPTTSNAYSCSADVIPLELICQVKNVVLPQPRDLLFRVLSYFFLQHPFSLSHLYFSEMARLAHVAFVRTAWFQNFSVCTLKTCRSRISCILMPAESLTSLLFVISALVYFL